PYQDEGCCCTTVHRGWAGILALLLAMISQSPLAAQPTQAAFDVFEATVPRLQQAMNAGKVTAAELVDAYLERIAAYDQSGPRINAILRLNPNARDEAAALDRERALRGPRGPLHGIPIVLKDNFDTADMPTTGASVALATH